MSLDLYLAAGTSTGEGARAGFRHEVLAYRDEGGFVDGVLPFIVDGLDRDETVAVIESAAKVDLLDRALGRRAREVRFADVALVGLNPARIIPAWQRLLDDARSSGRRLRGIGEPAWSGRDDAELAECRRHESLLNTVFQDSGDWWLLCAYDTSQLSEALLDEAAENHPFILEGGVHRPSERYLRGFDVFGGVLAEPVAPTREVSFGEDTVVLVRYEARMVAERTGMPASRVADFRLAMHELAANSLAHGGGSGLARFWEVPGAVFGEVQDCGVIGEPLIGRIAPDVSAERGRGLWLVNQLCDLVQIRSSSAGSVVRVRMATGRAG